MPKFYHLSIPSGEIHVLNVFLVFFFVVGGAILTNYNEKRRA